MSDGPPNDDVTIVEPGVLAEMAGVPINPVVSVLFADDPGRSRFRYVISNFDNGPHERTLKTIEYLDLLRSISRDAWFADAGAAQKLFQSEDRPIDVASISWETCAGWQGIRLIPDVYYFQQRGYEDFNPALPPWEARHSTVVWRGASTGLFGQVVSDLDRLLRYRLCRLAAALGPKADIALTNVVQWRDPQQAKLIQVRLAQEGLLKPFLPMPEMARYRFIIDIDGNANSWNFIMKLKLGCCVLRVESIWKQWFANRLFAWEHYVPIAADLSNFLERVDWCLENQEKCKAIAERGKRFAHDMRFYDEMAGAAKAAFAPMD